MLRPVRLKKPVPTRESASAGTDGSVWYVWSDNTDVQTLTCLPYNKGLSEDDMFVYDLQTFAYADVECLPGIYDIVTRASHSASGTIALWAPDDEDLQAACAAGLMEMVGSERATLTAKGRALAPASPW